MERIAQLPQRPLVMTAGLMEFALQTADDDRIYLIVYRPREGAPIDPTKQEFDVDLAVLDADGVQVSPQVRKTTHTVLYDPSGAVQTPVESTPAVQIAAEVQRLALELKAWGDVMLNAAPLYEQLSL